MSIGGPTPGTLLIQRLDTVLGINLSQQANIVSGARPEAVRQPENPNRPDPTQNETLRHPRETADRVNAQSGRPDRPIAAKAQSAAAGVEAPIARSTTSTSSTPSAPTTLGQAARTILSLLALYPDTVASVTGKAPLTDLVPGSLPGLAAAVDEVSPGANAPAPATFARALAASVQTSGLFYESHLNNLAFGKQDVHSLQLEPQAQLSSAAETVRPGAAGLHPETHLLVRQQLEVLANQVFAWHGKAWPDAPMWWEIKRHGDAAHGDAETQPTKWSTRIALELPNLGSVEARLHLTGQTLMLHLAAPAAAALLHENAQALRTRCESFGLHLSHFSIDTNHEDGNVGAGHASALHEA